MLDDFIERNREAIFERMREFVAERLAPHAVEPAPPSGVALFVDQVVERLRGDEPAVGDLEVAACDNGGDMLREGFTVAQVVQGYGDVCRAVTDLAVRMNVPITTQEFLTLNRCVDVATAEAVSEYEHQRDRTSSDQETERMGMLVHELRNQLGTAMLSYDILTRGAVGLAGSTSVVLGRSLGHLRDTIDRTLADVRVDAGVKALQRVRLASFIEEVKVDASLDASSRGLTLVARCDGDAELDIDPHILASALGNLLQNAFKFTRAGGAVALRARAVAGRAVVDVEDECGGLPPGGAEALFRPYEQRSADRSGLGLGLAISRRGVEASGGSLRVRNLPLRGCVFTIDLPATAMSAPSEGGAEEELVRAATGTPTPRRT